MSSRENLAEKVLGCLYTALGLKPGDMPGSLANMSPYTPRKIGPDSTVARTVTVESEKIDPNYWITGSGTVEEQVKEETDRANTKSAIEKRNEQTHNAYCR